MDQFTSSRQEAYLQIIIDGLEPEQQHSNHDSVDYDPQFIVQYKQQEALESNKRKSNDDILLLIKQTSENEDLQNQFERLKKLKTDQQPELKIPRKVSDDLMKLFEQMPEDQIQGLIEKLKTMNTPDLRLKLDVSRLLSNDLNGFSLNEGISSNEEDGSKKISGKKREKKECMCCNQIVKRHQCKHTTCSKPCSSQSRTQKSKEKE